jgi:HPt (histidine-containing phosphotransfer) domain-containing protein
MIERQFDPADAMRMLRCDQTELIALALHLLDHCHQACDGLELALVSGEWRGVNALLQKIRNGCAVLRAERACELARELEHKMRLQTLAAADLDALAGALRDLAIDLLRFVTDTRGEQRPDLALAA